MSDIHVTIDVEYLIWHAMVLLIAYFKTLDKTNKTDIRNDKYHHQIISRGNNIS